MLQLAVNVIVLGAIYALIASGYVMVYRVSRVLNLAHGELMMLGAYLLLQTATSLAFGVVGAVVFAAMMSIVVGILVYVFLMRWMTGQAVLAAVLTTISFGIFLRGFSVLAWESQHHYPGKLLSVPNTAIPVGDGAFISAVSLTILIVTIIAYGALFGFLRFGRWGVRMRACGQNPLLAAQSGINLHIVYALAWAISTFTGALAGILVSLETGVSGSLALIGLKAFPGALVGGLDSLVGAILGSLIVAAAEVAAIQYVSPLLADVIPFVILIVMLAFRPWGFFGTKEELNRV
ncbi:MAG: branched-chain amino acid ABC transporter permease [Burkholderiales bacterium]